MFYYQANAINTNILLFSSLDAFIRSLLYISQHRSNIISNDFKEIKTDPGCKIATRNNN